MFIHRKLNFLSLSAGLTALTLFVTSCSVRPIDSHIMSGETGEYYSAHSSLQDDFDAFCHQIFRTELQEGSTLDLHYTLLHPDAYGIDTGEITLGTCDLQDMIQNNQELKTLRSNLLNYERSLLTAQQQLTYDALLDTLDTQLMAEGLELYEQPLAPTIGLQAQLPVLLAEYAFHSPKDVEDYLLLLEQMDIYYEQILQFEHQRADAGLAPSDASIDAIIASCEGYLRDFPLAGESASDSDNHHTFIATNFLSETFTSRLEDLETNHSLTIDQKADYIARHDQAIAEHFIPAYELLINGMAELKGRGLNDGGLAGFQDGKRYYEYLLRSGPALSYSVQELKQALSKRMEQDLTNMNALYTKYPDLDDQISNAAYTLTDPQEILDDLKLQIAAEFPELPECDYEINVVPSSLEDILSPAFYLTAPLDDLDQNVIYINRSCYDSAGNLYTTLAHEGFPGHLYQTVYSRSTRQTNPLMTILTCSGANEGWATYVEHYANMYDTGLPEGVGEYYALLRSYSLCVHGMLDIGINYDGWDRETADRFVSACFQVDEETLDELWQVMIDNPTNYLEYCGGFLEIMEMRTQAEVTLGDRFSDKEFHKFLLDIGPVSFSVIRPYFDRWLNAQL